MGNKDDESDDLPYSINQTMTNSPGSLQAGRDIIINPDETWGLNPEQLETLRRRMAPFARPDDRGDLITCLLGEAKSTGFAINLMRTFRAAGWNLSGIGYNQAIFAEFIQGVVIRLHSPDSNPPGFMEFVNTLREAGIEPVGEIVDSLPPDRFQIIVGTRPHR